MINKNPYSKKPCKSFLLKESRKNWRWGGNTELQEQVNKREAGDYSCCSNCRRPVMSSVSIIRAQGQQGLYQRQGHPGLLSLHPWEPLVPLSAGCSPPFAHQANSGPTVPEIPVAPAPHLRSLAELLSNSQHQKEPPGFKYSKILNFWPHTWAVNALLLLCTPPVPLLPSEFWGWGCGRVDQVGFCISFFSDTL